MEQVNNTRAWKKNSKHRDADDNKYLEADDNKHLESDNDRHPEADDMCRLRCCLPETVDCCKPRFDRIERSKGRI